MVEETKKEQHTYQVKITKLQKQLELARKKGDHWKVQSLEVEVTSVRRGVWCVEEGVWCVEEGVLSEISCGWDRYFPS